MIGLLVASAYAGPAVIVGVHQTVPDTELPQAVGVQASAELPVRGRFGADVGLSVDPAERFFGGWAGGRASIVGGLSVGVGAGAAGIGAPGLAATGVASFDVDLGRSLGIRLETRGWTGPDLAALQLGLSARWHRAEAPAVVVEPEPPVDIPAVTPPPTKEGLVWLSHPVCAWVPQSEVARWEGVASAGDPFAPRTGPPQGAFVIVASRSDVVTVDEAVLPVADDGIALVNAGEGVHVAHVVGGGREETVEAAVAAGYVTWVRASDPAERLVHFAGGSSTVSDAARAELAAIVHLAGGWRFRVAGSYSPEGDPDGNRRLAEARAAAVRDALVAAGLPADRVVVAPPTLPPAGVPPEDQRVARVIPW